MSAERRSLGRLAACRCWSVLLALPLVFACEPNNVKPVAPGEPETLYWELELNQHAVTLSTYAPYDTLTLSATPRNFGGEPLAGLPAPQYASTDIERVLVSPDGRLVAVAASGLVPVVATLTVGNLKHSDTVWVRVVEDAAPPVLASLSIHPTPPDSAKVAAAGHSSIFGGLCGRFPVQVIDTAGLPIHGVPVFGHSSDTTVLTIDRDGFSPDREEFCKVEGQRPGSATIYASATVFGTTKADTLLYRVGWPLASSVSVQPTYVGSPVNMFVEPEIRIGAGGFVVWSSSNTDTETSVIFADPTSAMPLSAGASAFIPAGSGWTEDLLLFLLCDNLWQVDCRTGGNFVLPPRRFVGGVRLFQVPGTYAYSTSAGASVRIIVIDEQ